MEDFDFMPVIDYEKSAMYEYKHLKLSPFKFFKYWIGKNRVKAAKLSESLRKERRFKDVKMD